MSYNILEGLEERHMGTLSLKKMWEEERSTKKVMRVFVSGRKRTIIRLSLVFPG
jgi:hypothetical protein